MTLPSSMQRSMAAEAEADREARAKVRGSTHRLVFSRGLIAWDLYTVISFHGSDFYRLRLYCIDFE